MLVTVSDYEKIKGLTLADEEKAKVETLLNVAVSQIEEMLGYSLEKQETTEKYDLNRFIYLNCRPVVEVKKVEPDIGYETEKNFIEILKYRDCPCCCKNESVKISYTFGYETLPEWLKYELIGIVDSFIDEMSNESKLTSYKIDDISYSYRDYSQKKSEKINQIVRRIYG